MRFSILLPRVDAQVGAQRSSSSLPDAVEAAGQPDARSFQASLQLSCEVDLSGALCAARDAAKSDLVAAEVARQYFTYRSAEKRLAIAEQLVQSERQSAKVVAARVEQGESSSFELDLAHSDALENVWPSDWPPGSQSALKSAQPTVPLPVRFTWPTNRPISKDLWPTFGPPDIVPLCGNWDAG